MGTWKVSNTKGSLEKARWQEPIGFCAQGTELNITVPTDSHWGEADKHQKS